jgi:hypothetical protein
MCKHRQLMYMLLEHSHAALTEFSNFDSLVASATRTMTTTTTKTKTAKTDFIASTAMYS